MNDKQFATLAEISCWHKDKKVILPQVQRGFVWKPYQIENLWDSLLRGYPVGSFIFSESKEENAADSLLDGQQRATSIGLAFAEPGDESSYLNGKGVAIYLDLKIPEANDTREFVFRVITKSHPWGYRRETNRKPLTRQNMQLAKAAYGLKEGDKYYEMDLKKFWPFDSGIPLPVYYFLEAALDSEKGILWLKKELTAWIEKLTVTKSFAERAQMLEKFKKCMEADQMPAKDEYYSVLAIFKKFETMLATTTIPTKFLQLQFEEIERIAASIDLNKSDDDNGNEIEDEDDEDQENQDHDDIENLFVRLNSAGTPLRGEDLNYSILKSEISYEAQEKIELACKGLISPASFITICYRLHQYKSNKKPALNLRVKPKEFQKSIRVRNEAKAFQDTVLTELVPALEQVKKILKYDTNTCPFGLSSYLLTNLCHRSPQIVMMLMYRLTFKGDYLVSKDMKKRVIGIMTMFSWFARSSKSNYDHLMTNIRHCMETFSTDEFWSHTTVSIAQKDTHDNPIKIHALPKRIVVKKVNSIINSHFGDKRNGSINKLKPDDKKFFKKVFFEKSLILFAQREYFEKEFHAIEFELDDMNVPFDWDHISPQDLIRKNKDISQCLIDWYQSIGNFRALSLSKNRAKGSTPPAVDFKENKESAKESFCEYNEWKHHHFSREDLKSNQYNQREVVKLLLNRGSYLFQEWYDQLEIGELIKTKNLSLDNFKKCLKKNFWTEKEDEFQLPIGSKDKGIFISFIGEDDERFHSDMTEIGFFALNEATLKNMVIPPHSIVHADDNTYSVYQSFTFGTDSNEMVIQLFQELVNFLKCIEENSRHEILDILKQGISNDLATKIVWPERQKFKESA